MRSLFIITLLIFGLSACSAKGMKRACFGNVCIESEIADSQAERSRGLMLRKYLAPKQGMLFIFPEEDKHSFWMKNMKFPLDLIWIGGNKKVVDIKTYVSPCGDTCESYSPLAKALYVLEVNAGFVKQYNVSAGDTVSIE